MKLVHSLKERKRKVLQFRGIIKKEQVGVLVLDALF